MTRYEGSKKGGGASARLLHKRLREVEFCQGHSVRGQQRQDWHPALWPPKLESLHLPAWPALAGDYLGTPRPCLTHASGTVPLDPSSIFSSSCPLCISTIGHPRALPTGDFISWTAPGSADPLLLVRRELGPSGSPRPVLELLGSDMGVAAVWMMRGGNRLFCSSGCSPRDTTAGATGREPESTQGCPRARGCTLRIGTHRPSASSCPHRHPRWVRRNQALTRIWWHLPKVGSSGPLGPWPGRGHRDGPRSPSLHTHTPRIHRPQEPATTQEACTGAGQTTQAWAQGSLGPP